MKWRFCRRADIERLEERIKELENLKRRETCGHGDIRLLYHPATYPNYMGGPLGGLFEQMPQQPLSPPTKAYWSGSCADCGKYLNEDEILAKLNANRSQ